MCWLVCCAGCCAACAASAVCACCSFSVPRMAAKYMYGILFLLTLITMWIMRDYAPPALQYLYSFESCAGDYWCVGALAVLRLSFGLVCFYLFMLIVTLGPQDEDSCADQVHVRWWPLKILAWLALLAAPFFIPAVVFQIYGQIAIGGSAIFLIIQLISLLNFIYVWNDTWLEDTRMHVWMVLVSVVCYALALTGLIFCYIFFAPSASCGLNIFFITFALILIIAFSAISIFPQVNAGPLTSGVMALYLVFLCWSSIMSEPASYACNTRPRQSGYGTWIDILAFVLALFSIVVSVYSVGIDSRCISLRKAAGGDPELGGDAAEGEAYNLSFFHVVFALGAMYLAMLFLGWNMQQMPAKWSFDAGWFSVWVKMVLLWISALLYIWTMVAPLMFPGRDFN